MNKKKHKQYRLEQNVRKKETYRNPYTLSLSMCSLICCCCFAAFKWKKEILAWMLPLYSLLLLQFFSSCADKLGKLLIWYIKQIFISIFALIENLCRIHPLGKIPSFLMLQAGVLALRLTLFLISFFPTYFYPADGEREKKNNHNGKRKLGWLLFVLKWTMQKWAT